jgi:hypothetical protein
MARIAIEVEPSRKGTEKMSEQRERRGAVLTEYEIAARAYQKWKERGCPQDDGKRDWFAALAEMDAERARHEYEAQIALYD